MWLHAVYSILDFDRLNICIGITSPYYLDLEYQVQVNDTLSTDSNFIKAVYAIDRVRRLKSWHDQRTIGDESTKEEVKN